MILDFLFFTFLGLVCGGLIAFVAKKFRLKQDPLVEQINSLLPQTQCAQCGYPGCLPYAQAIAKKEASINLCPPGGEETIQALAELLHLEVEPIEKPIETPHVVFIDENKCIGCVLCIKACPVDAIIGATKQMHTIIEKECTGCDLCIPVCPVDCIYTISITEEPWKWEKPLPA